MEKTAINKPYCLIYKEELTTETTETCYILALNKHECLSCPYRAKLK